MISGNLHVYALNHTLVFNTSVARMLVEKTYNAKLDLPRARMREGVKESVLSVSQSVSQSVQ